MDTEATCSCTKHIRNDNDESLYYDHNIVDGSTVTTSMLATVKTTTPSTTETATATTIVKDSVSINTSSQSSLLLRPGPSIGRILEEFYTLEASLLASESIFQESSSDHHRHHHLSVSTSNSNSSSNSHPNMTTYLNHASFGNPYRSTLTLRHYITTTLCYDQPMVYHRSLVPILVERSRSHVCEYLGINTRSVVSSSSSSTSSSSSSSIKLDDIDANHTEPNNNNGFVFCNVSAALFAILQSISLHDDDNSIDDDDDDDDDENKIASTTRGTTQRTPTVITIITSDMLYHSLTDTLACMSSTAAAQNNNKPSILFRWIQVPTPSGARSEDIYRAFEGVLKREAEKTTAENVKEEEEVVVVTETDTHQDNDDDDDDDDDNNDGQRRPPTQQKTTRRKKTRIIVICDHISSKPSVVFPIQRICALCQTLHIPTIIDGAHGPGGIPRRYLNIGTDNTINPTFYTMTFHKWCNTPRGGGSGGLWVNMEHFGGRNGNDGNVVSGGGGNGSNDDNKNVINYDDIFDLSRLTLDHGRWAGTATGTMKMTGQQQQQQLYLDHTSKPGYLTDHITQGIYDESTREYENVILLKHCLDLVRRFEDDVQHHVRTLRRSSRDVLQRQWNLSDDMANIWYGDDVYDANDKDDDRYDETVQTVKGVSRGWEPTMLSIPLPADELIGAMQFISNNVDGNDDDGEGHANTIINQSPTWTRIQKLKWLKKTLVGQLWADYSIEVPMFVWTRATDVDNVVDDDDDDKSLPLLGVRISFGRHVRIEDVERLGMAVLDIIRRKIPVPK